MMEILEKLRQSAGCGFISDLRYDMNNKLARAAIKDIRISEYSLGEISDAVSYIYGNSIKFNTIDDAKLFFSKHCD